MSTITMSFDVAERQGGWCFRHPAGDESAPWSSPYPSRRAAEEAAVKACEEHLARAVASALGVA
ncbi:hypothetical protein SAMN05216358_0114 [Rhizobium sp. AN5]|uniref:hypothetical protein n=1 Tax=Rhizobium sp. AN5 TaxID=1855304 RepID=UPI000BD6AE13|nr:hypothetical protein [Rhizobium sp. AN5]SOC90090.1 hypothetical protein SAMN05216358_0114 [Rhizobium sp. AN5]